jgi:hypothetical protein
MNYRHLPLKCQCGEVPDHITEVGFSDDRQLVVHWFCSNCRKLVYVVKPLMDCWRECPSPVNSLEAHLELFGETTDENLERLSDLEFLRSVGVKPC